MCSHSVDVFVNKCGVLYNYISSDHKPLTIDFNNLLQDHHCLPPNVQAASFKTVADWSRADDFSIFLYQNELELTLASVKAPTLTDLSCLTYSDCVKLIDKYYNEFVSCLNSAVLKCIPHRAVG